MRGRKLRSVYWQEALKHNGAKQGLRVITSSCAQMYTKRVVFVVPASSARVRNLRRLHQRPVAASVYTICTAACQRNPACHCDSWENRVTALLESQRTPCASMAPSDSSSRYWRAFSLLNSVLRHVRRFRYSFFLSFECCKNCFIQAYIMMCL